MLRPPGRGGAFVAHPAFASRSWRRYRKAAPRPPRADGGAADNFAMFALPSIRRRSLSCGIVVLLESRELLLCHVTGQRHWDLPKGGIEAGESALDAALRETHEETGLVLAADALLDLGRHSYTAKKDLHLFACRSPRIDPRELHCASCFVDRLSGRTRPEMDGFGWFSFDRIAALCTPKLAGLLTSRLDLAATLGQLVDLQQQPLAA